MNEDNKMHYIFGALLGIAGLVILLIFVSLSSQANDEEPGTATTDIDNTAPRITAVEYSAPSGWSAGTLTLTDGPDNLTTDTETVLSITVTYEDDNGCADVDLAAPGVSGSYLLVGADSYVMGCNVGNTVDPLGCFNSVASTTPDTHISCAPVAGTCTGTGGDIDGQFKCDLDLRHYSLPSNWSGDINVVDAGFASANTTTSFVVATTTAISLINTTLDFGTQTLGATTTANAVTSEVRNTGNIATTLSTYGTAFTCSGADDGSFTVDKLKYSTTTGLAYESLDSTLSGSLVAIGTTLSSQTEVTTITNNTHYEEIYWGLAIPDAGVAGTCQSTVTVTGVTI
ncbi:hypothetical protein KKG22_02745 [Patescibacteria group bacterium]|nr:hypothetical protein [Patescibacteria group bacterium]MBU1721718.1 hypothetical protein [Patescibacteria group bacterium]MBU1901872.1 hypothetical protein [Patescibacteria group bacterium]